jgi:hypothetical protein
MDREESKGEMRERFAALSNMVKLAHIKARATGILRKAQSVLKRVWPVLGRVLLALMIIAAVAVGLWAGYTYENDWTGFRDYQPKPGTVERGKTLWDWLDLLIIPAVLALGALWVNRNAQKNEQRRADRENQIERQIASERNQEAALQAYLDRMTDLLLREDGLRAPQPGDKVRSVARTRTLTVLRDLEAERNVSSSLDNSPRKITEQCQRLTVSRWVG